MPRSPIVYFGGKGHMVRRILSWFPPHHVYVEPFGGGASLLMAKTPSAIEVYNDIHVGLVSLFRVLRDKQKAPLLYEMLQLTPYSRREHADACRLWRFCDDELLRAYHFFVAVRQSFCGNARSWGFDVGIGGVGKPKTIPRWLASVESLPEVTDRLKRVQVECRDWSECVKTYDTPETLFYCDPPYPSFVRREQNAFEHELDKDGHAHLLGVLRDVAGMVILSSYPNDAYDSSLEGWRRMDWETVCSAVPRTRGSGILGSGILLRMHPRTECIYVSPNAERQLRAGRQMELPGFDAGREGESRD